MKKHKFSSPPFNIFHITPDYTDEDSSINSVTQKKKLIFCEEAFENCSYNITKSNSNCQSIKRVSLKPTNSNILSIPNLEIYPNTDKKSSSYHFSNYETHHEELESNSIKNKKLKTIDNKENTGSYQKMKDLDFYQGNLNFEKNCDIESPIKYDILTRDDNIHIKKKETNLGKNELDENTSSLLNNTIGSEEDNESGNIILISSDESEEINLHKNMIDLNGFLKNCNPSDITIQKQVFSEHDMKNSLKDCDISHSNRETSILEFNSPMSSESYKTYEKQLKTKILKYIEECLEKDDGKYNIFLDYLHKVKVTLPLIKIAHNSKYNVIRKLIKSFAKKPFLDFAKENGTVNKWSFFWSDGGLDDFTYTKLNKGQKVNHLPGMQGISRKAAMARKLSINKKRWGKEFDFFPETWILPAEMGSFLSSLNGKSVFIVKPDGGSQGKGIVLVTNKNQLPSDINNGYVAQRYISDPLLLDGCKVDVRLYVLVSHVQPLSIFLHKEGLVRLASQRYEAPTKQNMSKSTIHLTNYSVNVHNPDFCHCEDDGTSFQGHKRSWRVFLKRLAQLGVDTNKLELQIEELIVKTILSVHPTIYHSYRTVFGDSQESGAFELLGIDILFKKDLTPLLLEFNSAPSLGTDSPLDQVIKSRVLKDMFNLVFGTEHLYRREMGFRSNIKVDTNGKVFKKDKYIKSKISTISYEYDKVYISAQSIKKIASN